MPPSSRWLTKALSEGGTRATSQPEPEGPPPRFPGMADGPVSWGGLRWFAYPLYMLAATDADVRQQNMLHGLFHRIQPELGLTPSDGFNEHLDTLEGTTLQGDGWSATLNSGWVVRPAAPPGSFTIVREE